MVYVLVSIDISVWENFHSINSVPASPVKRFLNRPLIELFLSSCRIIYLHMMCCFCCNECSCRYIHV